MLICAALAAASLGAPQPARAQDATETEQAARAADPQGLRMTAAYKAWAKRWGVTTSSFAAMRGEEVIGQAWVGARRPATPVKIASLSKAITGVCIVKLVEARKLVYGARIGTLLPAYFAANKPADPRARLITVGQLLTHTSGITYDPTQGLAFAAFDFRVKNLAPQVTAALTKPLGTAPGKGFSYNNANYAVLGLIIETLTRKPYERHCADTVLKPAGVVGARLEPTWAVLSSYGGWRLSALDYARFLDHFRPAARLLTSRPPAWPRYLFSGGAYYGPGAYVRPNGATFHFWHEGALRWRDATRSDDFGAFFAMWKQNVRFVATYAPQPPAGAVDDLDYQVYLAANP